MLTNDVNLLEIILKILTSQNIKLTDKFKFSFIFTFCKFINFMLNIYLIILK